MDKKQVEQKFILLLETFIPEDIKWKVNIDEDFKEMNILNSITIIQFIVTLEDEFDIEFDDDELSIRLYGAFRDILNKTYEKLNI